MIRTSRYFFLSLLILLSLHSCAQQNNYKVALIGFYNVENLFDTINQPEVNDEEFTPTGTKLYTAEVYKDKLKNLAHVISLLGLEETPDGVALLGVAEVENKSVLEDLCKEPAIKDRNYQIVHYDSPDERGIDVGLLYNPKYFKVLNSRPLNVPLKSDDGSDRKTRDVLYVYGKLDGEPVHIFVNHWPSRRGGEQASAPGRAMAAGVCKAAMDSILKTEANSKVILMGDLNDDPVSPSVAKVIGAKGDINKVGKSEMYNPWMSLYKKGIGTLAYNDAWNLFDQIVISQSWLEKEQTGFFYHKQVIFKRQFLLQQSGRYKGYPFRTYDFNVYMSGYSDHFPVYLQMLKKN